MQYVIVIKSPYFSPASLLALDFVSELTKAGHQILQVFFVNQGVELANSLILPPCDEINFSEKWQNLALLHNFPLVVCVTNASRRGIDDTSLQKHFTLATLSDLATALDKADRCITF